MAIFNNYPDKFSDQIRPPKQLTNNHNKSISIDLSQPKCQTLCHGKSLLGPKSKVKLESGSKMCSLATSRNKVITVHSNGLGKGMMAYLNSPKCIHLKTTFFL
jgi:hypothetical protein